MRTVFIPHGSLRTSLMDNLRGCDAYVILIWTSKSTLRGLQRHFRRRGLQTPRAHSGSWQEDTAQLEQTKTRANFEAVKRIMKKNLDIIESDTASRGIFFAEAPGAHGRESNLKVSDIETIPFDAGSEDKLKRLEQREACWIYALKASTYPALNEDFCCFFIAGTLVLNQSHCFSFFNKSHVCLILPWLQCICPILSFILMFYQFTCSIEKWIDQSEIVFTWPAEAFQKIPFLSCLSEQPWMNQSKIKIQTLTRVTYSKFIKRFL